MWTSNNSPSAFPEQLQYMEQKRFIPTYFTHRILRRCVCKGQRFDKINVFLALSQELFFFFLFMATPAACGSAQARGRVRAVALHYSHSNEGSELHLRRPYTTAHHKARSPTHWMRPGIEPTSSWIPVGFVAAEPQQEFILRTSLSDTSFLKKVCGDKE